MFIFYKLYVAEFRVYFHLPFLVEMSIAYSTYYLELIILQSYRHMSYSEASLSFLNNCRNYACGACFILSIYFCGWGRVLEFPCFV